MVRLTSAPHPRTDRKLPVYTGQAPHCAAAAAAAAGAVLPAAPPVLSSPAGADSPSDSYDLRSCRTLSGGSFVRACCTAVPYDERNCAAADSREGPSEVEGDGWAAGAADARSRRGARTRARAC